MLKETSTVKKQQPSEPDSDMAGCWNDQAENLKQL